MDKRDILIVIMGCLIVGALVFCLFGTAVWYIGHDDGEAYERYMEQMMENGMYPDIYGYGWDGK